MPRASRHFLPGYVWHITHRCSGKFVPIVPIACPESYRRVPPRRFVQVVDEDNIVGISIEIGMRDRCRYLHWLFEAKKRYGLSVLNYVVTSNHVHLMVKDTGANVIAESMQLIAGRTAQEYNQRKGRRGAFWEDRYHATAIEADVHLHRCLAYIDLNMVRAIEY
jgi:putative transposase